jgi:hypothetical protein
MRPMLRRTVLFLPLAGLGAASAAWAVPAAPAAAGVVVEGVRFDERIRLGGADLLLNGTGVRAVAWFKGYVAALYVPERARSAAELLAQGGPRRLRLAMLQNAPAGEFVKAFEKGIARNSSEAQLAVLRERMGQFERHVAELLQVQRGDVVDLDFEPPRGTVLVVNGKLRGQPVAGADFYAALLRAFIGDRPYDKKLRDGLLGLGG